MSALLTGAAFGAALTAAGVYQPSVIVSQLRLENWHMIQAFLMAAASSALLVTTAQRVGYVQLRPRNPSTVGLFGRYDGNILGGLLLGIGMALSGACPGTVLAQTALGIRSGFFALGGGLLAGIVWSGYLKRALSKQAAQVSASVGNVTVYESLGLSHDAALIGVELIFASVVAATSLWTPLGPEARISPILGGVIIGLAQLVSIFSRKSLIGVSASYEEAGDLVLWVMRGCRGARPGLKCLLFSLGMIGGSWSLASLVPSVIAPTQIEVSAASAVVGGFLMVLGSRIAGGCTSGHGISGISLLSMSSFITISVAFAGGAVLALLLK